jgi:tetratricopeptide (TPR) repeat protein
MLYRQAESKYAAGEVEAALDLMEQSYQLSQRPELLFNLGQLNRELGRCRPALARYREYLEQAPAGRRRADAERSVAELYRECPEPAAALPPVAPLPPPVVHRPFWTPTRIAGSVALGAGAAAGTGALLCGLAVKRAESDLKALGTYGGEYTAVERGGRRYQAWEVGLGVASAGMLTGGVLLLVLGAPANPSAAASLSLAVEPGGTRAAYSFQF